MKHSKKKKRGRPGKLQGDSVSVTSGNGKREEQRIVNSLMEAFSLASVEETQAAYKEANGDPRKAAEILSGIRISDNSEVFQTSCSSSSYSPEFDSDSSTGFTGANGLRDGVTRRRCRGSRGKKVVAATGSVYAMLGKDYVSSSPRKEPVKRKQLGDNKINVEDVEQYLCSMLGNDCELSMGVVKDVLGNCGYDVEKALEGLLDLSEPRCEPSRSNEYSSFSTSSGEQMTNVDFNDVFWQPRDSGSDSSSGSSGSEVWDSALLLDITGRSYAEVLVSSDSSSTLAAASLRTDRAELPQQLLESLFDIPKHSVCEPAVMNWRTVVKKLESFTQKRVELGPSSSPEQQLNNQALAKGAEYQLFRETPRQQWDKMRNSYRKAAIAYSNGEKNYATYLSEQGKLYNRMTCEADEKASMEIFKARNKGIENVLTIDLHGQHVGPAMRLVKLHLLFGTYISCDQPSKEGKKKLERREPRYSGY